MIKFFEYAETFHYTGRREGKLLTTRSFSLSGLHRKFGFILICLLHRSSCILLDETVTRKTYIYMLRRNEVCSLKTRHLQTLWHVKFDTFINTLQSTSSDLLYLKRTHLNILSILSFGSIYCICCTKKSSSLVLTPPCFYSILNNKSSLKTEILSTPLLHTLSNI